MSPLLILVAILPGILICLLLYRLDKFEKEDKVPLLIAFGLGLAVTYPALKIEEWVEHSGWLASGSIFATIISAFLVVAFTEELVKILPLLGLPFRQTYFNEPFDGIVYAVMIGMGFATLENVIYANIFGYPTTILRAFTAVPAHAVFAIIMGYYIGLAKFDKENRVRLILTGFFGAVLTHGIYDFFILQEIYEGLMLLAIVTLFISIYFSRKLIISHQENSPFRQKDDYLTEIPPEEE